MKKGFTLIEIIVCIGVLAVIGVSSFFGVKAVNNKIKANKLEELNDKIKEAVSVYIETNKEAKTQLYKDKNGVFVPLTVLQNEGLIDFQDIKIDSKKDYVIAMLGGFGPESACIDTTMIGSWEDGDKTIYLCTTSNGGTNIQAVGGSANNISRVTREPFYYTGADPNNYIEYNKKTYRILKIDIDDSLFLYSDEKLRSDFTKGVQDMSYYKRYNGYIGLKNSSGDYLTYGNYGGGINFRDKVKYISKASDNENILIDAYDVLKSADFKTSTCTQVGGTYEGVLPVTWLKISTSGPSYSLPSCSWPRSIEYSQNEDGSEIGYKIHLAPCMKIIGGTGDIATPFILDDSSCK